MCNGLVTGDGDQFVDVVDGASAAEVVAGLGETLEHWTYGFGTGEALNEFISDVTHFEAGEHEGVGLTGDRAAWSLA